MKSVKENQHFVPQFYLRKFSNDNNQKSISTYLKDRIKFIKSASIEGQSQKPYYYGKDGRVEDLLMELEGPASVLFDAMCKNCSIIKKPVQDYYRILHFTLNLCMRNPVQSRVLFQANEGFRTQFSNFAERDTSDSGFHKTLTPTQSVLLALHQSPRIARMCLDLGSKLIVNKTSTYFITSDNPVVRYNMLSSAVGKTSSGFASYGLQIFLPISPTLMLFFFDPKIYQVQEHEKDQIHITSELEIVSLNLMQVLNSTNCIYFTQVPESHILQLVDEAKNYSTPNKVIPLQLGSYVFQKVSELNVNLKLASVVLRPLQSEFFDNRFTLPIREYAKIIKESFNKKDEPK